MSLKQNSKNNLSVSHFTQSHDHRIYYCRQYIMKIVIRNQFLHNGDVLDPLSVNTIAWNFVFKLFKKYNNSPPCLGKLLILRQKKNFETFIIVSIFLSINSSSSKYWQGSMMPGLRICSYLFYCLSKHSQIFHYPLSSQIFFLCQGIHFQHCNDWVNVKAIFQYNPHLSVPQRSPWWKNWVRNEIFRWMHNIIHHIICIV